MALVPAVPPSAKASSPYVLYPAQSAQVNSAWTAYKLIQHSFWAWEDFQSSIHRDVLGAPANREIFTACCAVVNSHLEYLSGYPITQPLSVMCNSEKTAAGRCLYGVIIARSYIHLEVYSGLAVNFQRNYDPPFHSAQTAGARKIENLEHQLAAPLDSHPPEVSALVSYFVFSLGVLATLHTLHSRTDSRCFVVWERIFGDYVPLVQVHVAAVSPICAEDGQVLRTAYRVEETTTLDLLPEFLHEHVRQMMQDMFYSVFPALA